MSQRLRLKRAKPLLAYPASSRKYAWPNTGCAGTAPGGGKDLYIKQERFRAQFAADVPKDTAALMAATQGPITRQRSMNRPSHRIGSPYHHGSSMALAKLDVPRLRTRLWQSAQTRRKQSVIKGGSHVVMVSHPDAVAKIIEQAAAR